MDSLIDSTIIIQESMIRLAISHTHGVEHSLSMEHFYHLLCATTASLLIEYILAAVNL